MNKGKTLWKVSFWDDQEKDRPLSLEETEERHLVERISNTSPYWRKLCGGRSPKNCGRYRTTRFFFTK